MFDDIQIDDETFGLDIAMKSILVRLSSFDLVVRFDSLLLKYEVPIFREVSKANYRNFFL